MKTVQILVKRTPGAEDLAGPAYMSAGAAGMDLMADIREDLVIEPRQIKLVPTGISVAIPQGFEAQIRPRSGLALKHGLTLVNTPGTIDSDYRGVISLILVNLGEQPYTVKRGTRLAQMVIQETVRANLEFVSELPGTERAAGGFGHTGA